MSDRIAVIYYSLEGNTDYIARQISEKTGAELIRLVPKKEYPTGKVSKYIWGGKSATFGEMPPLDNSPIDLNKYDTIILGCPLWAGKITPPMNTFLNTYEIKDKNIAIYMCCLGGNTDKVIGLMEEKLASNKMLVHATFVEPLKNINSHLEASVMNFIQKI